MFCNIVDRYKSADVFNYILFTQSLLSSNWEGCYGTYMKCSVGGIMKELEKLFRINRQSSCAGYALEAVTGRILVMEQKAWQTKVKQKSGQCVKHGFLLGRTGSLYLVSKSEVIREEMWKVSRDSKNLIKGTTLPFFLYWWATVV